MKPGSIRTIAILALVLAIIVGLMSTVGSCQPAGVFAGADKAAELSAGADTADDADETDGDAGQEDSAYGFSDVTAETAHCEEILRLKQFGVAAGFPDGTFRPNNNCSRADMATFLYRTAKKLGAAPDLPKEIPANTFDDVTESTAHWQEIVWLYETRISRGWYNSETKTSSFRPDAEVARGDMAAFLYRLVDYVYASRNETRSWNVGRSFFEDVTYGETSHATEILWMGASGVSQGWEVDGAYYFRPNETARRGDVAFFIAETIDWCSGE